MTIRRRVGTLQAGAWALRAALAARREVRAGRMPPYALPPVPPVPESSVGMVQAVLAPRLFTCLVRASVRQAWHAAHGWRRDLIIGVRAPGEDFGAHAWLEGDHSHSVAGYHELTRRSAA